MRQNHIRDHFFTISGYMSNTVNFIKEKYKIVLIASGIYAACICIPLIVYNQCFMLFFQNFKTYDIDRFIMMFLITAVIMFIYMLLFFFLQAFMKGVIFTQCRAYTDNCRFSLTDSLSYVCKRLGAYITASLSQLLIYLGAFAAFILYIVITGLISAGLIAYRSELYAVLFILFIFIGYFAFIAVSVFIALKLFFALPVSLNYNYGGFKALSYSNYLTNGFKGKIFGYMALFYAISFSISSGFSSLYIFDFLSKYATYTAVPYDLAGMISNPWVSVFSTLIMLALNIFSSIFFNFVFINIDSVKKKIPSAFDPLFHNAQDSFYQYCAQHEIQTDYEP